MVTSSELALSSETISIDVEEIYKIYESVAGYKMIPDINDIFGHYCTEVDSRITDFQQKFYLDDYDSESGNIPDGLIHEVAEYIRLPLDMTPEELRYILDYANFVYRESGVLQNTPLKEIW